MELPPDLRPGIVRPPRRARPGAPAAVAQAPGGETADTIMREVLPLCTQALHGVYNTVVKAGPDTRTGVPIDEPRAEPLTHQAIWS